MPQETIIGSEPVNIPALPGDLDAFPVYLVTTDDDGNEKNRRIIRVEVQGAIANRTAGWRDSLDAMDARDRQWLLQHKAGEAKGITERLGRRGVPLLYQWCAAGIVIFQAVAVNPSGKGHGALFSWRLAGPVHDFASQAADEKKALRVTQEGEARRLAAELSSYPAARQLVAIFNTSGDLPYWGHAIEAARRLLASGTLPAASECPPWFLLLWLGRGKKTDYSMNPQPVDEGGQGAVFRAEHKHTRIPVALKRLRFHDDDSVHRMGREISAGKRYGSHPNVMPVLDADPDGRWFIMPLADGSAARHADRLFGRRRHSGTWSQAVCEGLRGPHADGWIHRDIKPANILLLDGRWVVGDWGLNRRPIGQTAFRARRGPAPALGPKGSPRRRCPATPMTRRAPPTFTASGSSSVPS